MNWVGVKETQEKFNLMREREREREVGGNVKRGILKRRRKKKKSQ